MKTETKQVTDAELHLLERARGAARAGWILGECASEWTERYASGRTDADFGALVGASEDSVQKARRVWEVFGGESADSVMWRKLPGLTWSHFVQAAPWSDGAWFLEWASENGTPVNDMARFRSIRLGESEPESEPAGQVESKPADPSESEAAAESGAESYAPFSSSAVQTEPAGQVDSKPPFSSSAVQTEPAPTGRVSEQSSGAVVSKAAAALGRITTAAAAFQSLEKSVPESGRERFERLLRQHLEGLVEELASGSTPEHCPETAKALVRECFNGN